MANIRNHIRFGMTAVALGAGLPLFGQVDSQTLFFISDTHLDTHLDTQRIRAVKTTMGDHIKNALTEIYPPIYYKDLCGLAAEIRYVGSRNDRGGELQDNASSSKENTPCRLIGSAQAKGPVRVVMSTLNDILDYMDRYRCDKCRVYDTRLGAPGFVPETVWVPPSRAQT